MRGWSGDEGASVVEFALVLPLVVMLILGGITGGLAFSTSIAMADAVREGARFGATTAALPSATTPSPPDWSDGVIAQTLELSAGELPGDAPGQVCARLEKVGVATPIDSSTCDLQATLNVSPPSTPAGASGCVVKVWAARKVTIELGIVVLQPTWSRKSVARYERPC